MTSIIAKLKELSHNSKISLFFIISFFIVVLILGINATYAYYNNANSAALIRSHIGNFEKKGDINIEVYKRNIGGLYTKSYAVPALGYSLSSVSCTVAACETTDTSSSCYYEYSEGNNTISLSSNQRVLCKFYFDELAASDINVYIMKENINVSTNPKTYVLVNDIPAYGFVFSRATCDNDVVPTYNSNTRTFNVSTTEKTTCYAYFDSMGTNIADVTVHVYVQSAKNSSVYSEVDSIPSNTEYQLSSDVNHVSTCIKNSDSTISTAPTYTNGYININATEKVTCSVYLDIVPD